jgi:hypothetical protein
MSSILPDFLKPDTLPQIIVLATGVVTFIGTVATLISNFMKEGILFASKRLKNSELMSCIEKLAYLDDNAKNNCKNSIVFRAMTGKQAPIHEVNLILNCYDPILAMDIYSKADKYIQFDKDDQLSEPDILLDGGLKFMKILFAAMSVISLFLLALSFSYSLTLIINVPKQGNLFASIIFLGFSAFSSGIGLVLLKNSLDRFDLLFKAKKFYRDYLLSKVK